MATRPPHRTGAHLVPARLGRRDLFVAAAFLLVGLNLRPALAALPPVLPQIRTATGLSSAEAGLLTTLPLLSFGALAFATPRLTRRLGRDRLLVSLLGALVGGIALRLVAGSVTLFVGTILAGCAIAIGNVLLPALFKRDFPRQVGILSGLHATALSGGAALAAGTIVPLSKLDAMGWRAALALWAIPALVAAAALSPIVRRRDPSPPPPLRQPTRRLWRDPLTWCVSGFMGLQSLVFYTSLTWVPTLLQAGGDAPAVSGWLISLASFVSIPAALTAPITARRLIGYRPLVAVAAASCASAFVGLAVDPIPLATLWMVLLGFGQGTTISLALGFIVLRAPDPEKVGELSMLAQGTGYLVAGLGPVTLGVLHQLSGGWVLPMLALSAVLLLELLAGLAASTDRHVGEPRQPHGTPPPLGAAAPAPTPAAGTSPGVT